MRIFILAFFGKLCAALFIALCIALGFGPTDWAVLVLGTEEPLWVWALRFVLIVGAGALFWFVFISRTKTSSNEPEPENEYIGMKEAATIAYEETRGTKAAEIAESVNRDDVLGYYAHALFNGTTTLYGTHPPSQKLEEIPNEEYGRCRFEDDYSSLRRHSEQRNIYENVQIKRSDLERRIQELKDTSDAVSNDTSETGVRSSSLTWFDLEGRFKELEEAMRFTRIDGQTGAAGEDWRLAGIPEGDASRRFMAIAAMASAKLFEDFPGGVNTHPELRAEQDPVIRWYKALQFIAGRYEQHRPAQQIDDDGIPAGTIFTGTIERPAEVSATLCLELASRPKETP